MENNLGILVLFASECINLIIAAEQEEYIKEEQRNLKRELLRAQEEVKRIQSVPLVIGQFLEMVDANSGIVGSTTGSNYYVRSIPYVWERACDLVGFVPVTYKDKDLGKHAGLCPAAKSWLCGQERCHPSDAEGGGVTAYSTYCLKVLA